MFLLSVPLCPSVLLSPLPNPSSHALAEASQELAAILLSASWVLELSLYHCAGLGLFFWCLPPFLSVAMFPCHFPLASSDSSDPICAQLPDHSPHRTPSTSQFLTH